MILSDVTIVEYIDAGKIKILPEFDRTDIRPTGIRLHLGEEILIPVEDQLVDLTAPSDIKYKRQTISTKGYILNPGMFILASTHEKVMTYPGIVGHLDGRSTFARLGLSLHCTSSIIDGIHDEPRAIVLEIKNNGFLKLVLKPKIPIGMLVFSKLSHPIRQSSQAQYRNQNSVEPPNLHFRKGE
jgi:dCTP deaminase